MNKFTEAIAKIDERIAKQKADVSKMAELAVAKFDKLAAVRKELVQNVKMIFERESSSDFVFDDDGVTWEITDTDTGIQIVRTRDGVSNIVVTPYADIKFIDIHTVSDLKAATSLLDHTTEENKRIAKGIIQEDSCS